MMVEGRLKEIQGVQFVVSTVSGYSTRSGENRFWAGFFVAYTPTEETSGNFLFNVLHDTRLDLVPDHKKKMTPHERLCKLIKDHKNACIKVCKIYLL